MDAYPLAVGFSLAIGIGLVANATLSTLFSWEGGGFSSWAAALSPARAWN
jgi:hypothetical protein